MSHIEILTSLSKDEQEAEIESKISETLHDILDAGAVSAEIANTNALGWGVDVFDILDIDLGHPDEIRVRIEFTLSGNQEDDKPFCGTSIEGEALAIIDGAGHVRYCNVTAERDLGNDDDEPAE